MDVREIWKDAGAGTEERISDLLDRMTREEKVGCFGCDNSLPRLGFRGSGHLEGLHGASLGGPGKWGGPEGTQATTVFPQSTGLASTWDAELVRKAAEQESVECRYLFQDPRYRRGALIMRAPNADLVRDIRWGRTEESFGEEPFLAGTMAAAFVRGLQGDDARQWRVASLLKHFLANSNEDERSTSSSDFPESLWHDYYAEPFRMAVEEGGARAMMAAYNSWNGVPCTIHPMLEQKVRQGWGMDGIICTDGGALRLLVSDHKWFRDLPEAVAACVKAGINQFLDDYRPAMEQALDEGLLTEDDLDAGLRPVFRVLVRLGLMDPEGSGPWAGIRGDGRGGEADVPPWERPETRELVRKVTAASVVLLQNRPVAGPGKGAPAPLLPLDTTRVRRIALIGDRARGVLGDWYAGTPPYEVDIFRGLRDALDPSVELFWVPSPRQVRKAAQVGDPHQAHADGVEESMDYGPVCAAAAGADLAIVVAGNHPTGDGPWAVCKHPTEGKEAVDRKDIALREEGLLKAVLRANPRTVAVLLSSFPVASPWVEAMVPAAVHMTHCSQEQGNGLADVLTGKVNPSGRLVHTWLRSARDLGDRLDYDVRKGRTCRWFAGAPLYPFGHGLSYSEFAWEDIRLEQDGEGRPVVCLRVRNVAGPEGRDVVQVWLRRPGAGSAGIPLQELAAFGGITVPPAQVRDLRIPVDPRRLGAWDALAGRSVPFRGEGSLTVARSAGRPVAVLPLRIGTGD